MRKYLSFVPLVVATLSRFLSAVVEHFTFRRCVAIFTTACFMVNITGISVFAEDIVEQVKKLQKEQERHESVLNTSPVTKTPADYNVQNKKVWTEGTLVYELNGNGEKEAKGYIDPANKKAYIFEYGRPMFNQAYTDKIFGDKKSESAPETLTGGAQDAQNAPTRVLTAETALTGAFSGIINAGSSLVKGIANQAKQATAVEEKKSEKTSAATNFSPTEKDREDTVQAVTSWVNDYLAIDKDTSLTATQKAEKKAAMAAALGLSTDQVISTEQLTAIAAQLGDYLNGQGKGIFNCAVQSIVQVLGLQGEAATKAAKEAILIDILTGNLDTKSSGQMQLSFFSMKKTAEINGVKGLEGYKMDQSELSGLFSSGSTVVARMTVNGVGHFVVVTGMNEDGTARCIDNGTQRDIALSEFTGEVLTDNKNTGREAMSERDLRLTKGASIFGAIASAISTVVRTVVSAVSSAVSGGSKSSGSSSNSSSKSSSSPSSSSSSNSGSSSGGTKSNNGSSSASKPATTTPKPTSILGTIALGIASAFTAFTSTIATGRPSYSTPSSNTQNNTAPVTPVVNNPIARFFVAAAAALTAYLSVVTAPKTTTAQDLARADKYVQQYGSAEAYAAAIKSKEMLGIKIEDQAAANAFKAANATLFNSDQVTAVAVAITNNIKENIPQAAATAAAQNVTSTNSMAAKAIGIVSGLLGLNIDTSSLKGPVDPVSAYIQENAAAISKQIDNALKNVDDKVQGHINAMGGAQEYWDEIAQKNAAGEKLDDVVSATYFLYHLTDYGFPPAEERIAGYIASNKNGTDGYYSDIINKTWSGEAFTDPEAANLFVNAMNSKGEVTVGGKTFKVTSPAITYTDPKTHVEHIRTATTDIVVTDLYATVTNKDGTTTTITYDEPLTGAQIDKLQTAAVTGGFDAVKDVAMADNLYKGETMKDAKGKVVYTAEKVGYNATDSQGNPTTPSIAVQYNYSKDYNDGYFIKDAKAGESKLVVKSFDADGNPQQAMVYGIDKTQAASTEATTLQNGLTIKGGTLKGSIGQLQQVSKWETTDAGGKQIATVEFQADESGTSKPFALETSVLQTAQGTTTVSYTERILLTDAYRQSPIDLSSIPQQGGTSSGQSGDQSGTQQSADPNATIQRYQQILAGTDSLKIANSQAYDSYKYLSSSYLDMGKATYIEYSSVNPSINKVYTYDTRGDNDPSNDIKITALDVTFDEKDWRNNWHVATGADSKGVVEASQVNADGSVTHITTTGVVFGDDWKQDWKIKTGSESQGTVERTVQSADGTITTTSTTNVTFTSDKDPFGSSYSYDDRSKNQVVVVKPSKDGGYTKTTYENVQIDAGGVNYTADDESNNVFVREYDKSGNLVSATDTYGKGNQVSTVLLPNEFIDPSKGDTFTATQPITLKWTVKDGKLIADADNVVIDATNATAFTHRNPDGTTTEIQLLAGAKFVKDEATGAYVLEGEAQIGADQSITIEKPKAGAAASSSSSKDSKAAGAKMPDVQTNAVVVETDTSYKVSDGIISLRSGSYAVMGNNAIFKQGSKLNGVGTITSGNLKVSYDDKGNMTLAAETGTCKTKQENDTNVVTSTYDTKGLVDSINKNKKTGATLEMKSERDKNGNIVSTTVTLTATKKGDTGIDGYYVENLGKDKKAVLTFKLNAKNEMVEGSLKLSAGDSMFKTLYSSKSDGLVGVLYTSDKNGKLSQETVLRTTNDKLISLSTVNGTTFFGQIDKKTAVRIDIDAKTMTFKKSTVSGSIVKGTNGEGDSFKFNKAITVSTSDTKYKVSGIYISGNAKGQLMATLSQVKLSNNAWYNVSDSMTVPGATAGQLVMINVYDEKGKFKWHAYVTRDENGWRSVKDGDKIGDMTLEKRDNRWFFYTDKGINIGAGDGTLSGKKNYLEIKAVDGKFQLVTSETIDATYTYGGKTTKVKLNSGAEVVLSGYDAKKGFSATVTKGDIVVSGGIYISAQSKSDGKDSGNGGSGSMPTVNTKAKIVTKVDKNGNVTGYQVSNGTVSIRGGQLVVVGKGTVYTSGSVLSDQSEVTGNLKIVDFTSSGAPIYAAESGTASTQNGTLHVDYNTKGITSAYSKTSLNGTSSGNGGKFISGTATTYYKLTTAKGYSVLKTDKGNLVANYTTYKDAKISANGAIYTLDSSGNVTKVTYPKPEESPANKALAQKFKNSVITSQVPDYIFNTYMSQNYVKIDGIGYVPKDSVTKSGNTYYGKGEFAGITIYTGGKGGAKITVNSYTSTGNYTMQYGEHGPEMVEQRNCTTYVYSASDFMSKDVSTLKEDYRLNITWDGKVSMAKDTAKGTYYVDLAKKQDDGSICYIDIANGLLKVEGPTQTIEGQTVSITKAYTISTMIDPVTSTAAASQTGSESAESSQSSTSSSAIRYYTGDTMMNYSLNDLDSIAGGPVVTGVTYYKTSGTSQQKDYTVWQTKTTANIDGTVQSGTATWKENYSDGSQSDLTFSYTSYSYNGVPETVKKEADAKTVLGGKSAFEVYGQGIEIKTIPPKQVPPPEVKVETSEEHVGFLGTADNYTYKATYTFYDEDGNKKTAIVDLKTYDKLGWNDDYTLTVTDVDGTVRTFTGSTSADEIRKFMTGKATDVIELNGAKIKLAEVDNEDTKNNGSGTFYKTTIEVPTDGSNSTILENTYVKRQYWTSPDSKTPTPDYETVAVAYTQSTAYGKTKFVEQGYFDANAHEFTIKNVVDSQGKTTLTVLDGDVYRSKDLDIYAYNYTGTVYTADATKQVQLVNKLPTYDKARMADLTTSDDHKCIALPSAERSDVMFNGKPLSEYTIYENDGFYKEYELVDREGNVYKSGGSIFWVNDTSYIFDDNGGDNTSTGVRISRDGDTVTLEVVERTTNTSSTGTGYGYGAYGYTSYSDRSIAAISETYGEGGTKETKEVRDLGNNQMKIVESSRALNGELTSKNMTGTYSGDFETPDSITGIQGTINTYSPGNTLEKQVAISGGLSNIKWDKTVMTSYSPVMYTEEVIMSTNPNDRVGVKTVLNGGTITTTLDDNKSPKSVITDGVQETIYYNGEVESDVIKSQTLTYGDTLYFTKGNSAGYTAAQMKDIYGDNYSQFVVSTSRNEVITGITIEDQLKTDATGKGYVTTSDAVTRTTVTYYDASWSKTTDLNTGRTDVKAAMTSTVITKTGEQTTMSVGNDEYKKTDNNMVTTVNTYSDGSSDSLTTIDSEVVHVKSPTSDVITMQTGINSNSKTDADGNVTFNRTVNEQFIYDNKTNVSTTSTGIVEAGTTINGITDVTTTIAKTTVYDPNKDQQTVSINSSERKITDSSNRLLERYVDSGEYVVINDPQSPVEAMYGYVTGDENANTVVKYGRDTSHEVYKYEGNSTNPVSMSYVNQSYDYMAVNSPNKEYAHPNGTVTVTSGTKSYTYTENADPSKKEVSSITDINVELVYGLDKTHQLDANNILKRSHNYSVENNFKVETKDGVTTKTNDLVQHSIVFDYENGQYYLTEVANGKNSVSAQNGKIINKELSGDRSRWMMSEEGMTTLDATADTVLVNGWDSVKTGKYGDLDTDYSGKFDTKYQYDSLGRESGYQFTIAKVNGTTESVSYSNYTYDKYGRQTGCTYTKTSTDAKGAVVTESGTIAKTYTISKNSAVKASDAMASQFGTPLNFVTTECETTTKTTMRNGNPLNGKEATVSTEKSQYQYESSYHMPVSVMSNASIATAEVNVTAANMLSDTAQLRKTFVDIPWVQTKQAVAIVVGVVAAIAAVAVTICTAGLAAPGVITLMFVAQVAVTAAVATFAAVSAFKYAYNATLCFENGDIMGGITNSLGAIFSIFGGKMLIGGLKGMGAAIAKEGLKKVAKQIGIQLAKRAAIGAGIGAASTAAFVYADQGRITWNDAGKIALGGLVGGVSFAMTANVGSMLTSAGVNVTSQFAFASTTLTFMKNMAIGNFLKSYIDAELFGNATGNLRRGTEEAMQLKAVLNGAIDLYVFVSSVGGQKMGRLDSFLKSPSKAFSTLTDGIKALPGSFKNGYTKFKEFIFSGNKWNALRNSEAITSTFTKPGVYGALLGGGGSAAGDALWQYLRCDDKSKFEMNWAEVAGFGMGGFMLGGGLGNIAKEGFGNVYSGLKDKIITSLNPENLFIHSTEMVGRIVNFQMEFTTAAGILNKMTGGAVVDFFDKTGLSFIDSMGLNMVADIESFSSGSLLMGFNAMVSKAKGTMTSPQMWAFGAITGVVQPIFGPILQRTPILGTIMQPLSDFGNKIKNENLSMLWEEGFQETIPGAIGKVVFAGNPQASEVFQELFDKTPNMSSAVALQTASSNVGASYVNTISNTSKLNNRSVNTAATSINQLLTGTGSGLSMQIESQGSGYSVTFKGSNVNSRAKIQVNSAAELQSLMVSVGASVSNSANLKNGEVFAASVKHNIQALQANSGDMQGMSTAEQMDFVAGIGGVNLKSGDILGQYGVQTTGNLIKGALPVISAKDSSSAKKQQLQSIVTRESKALAAAATANPTAETVGELADVTAAIMGSNIDAAVKNSLVNDLTTAMASAISSMQISANDKSSLLANNPAFWKGLQNLGNAILMAKNGNAAAIYSAAILSNATLFNLAESQAAIAQAASQNGKDAENADEQGRSIASIVLTSAASLNLNELSREIANADAAAQPLLVNSLLQLLNYRLSNAKQLSGSAVKYVSSALTNIVAAIKSAKISGVQLAGDMVLISGIVDKVEKTGNTTAAVNEWTSATSAVAGLKTEAEKNVEYVQASREAEVTSNERIVDGDLKAELKKIVDAFQLPKNADGVIDAETAATAASNVLLGRMLPVVQQAAAKAGMTALLNEYLNAENLTDEQEKEYLTKLTPVQKEVPFGIQILSKKGGFSKGQITCLTGIFKALFTEKGANAKEKMAYAHQLRTAGGKTLIGLYTVMLMSTQKTTSDKFITWLTNKDANASDLEAHVSAVFGNSLGNVLFLSATKYKELQESGELRSALQKAGIVIGEYGTWNSLYSQVMSKLLSANENDPQSLAMAQHNIEVLAKAGIAVTGDVTKGEKVEVADKNKSYEAMMALSNCGGVGLDTVDVPLNRIGDAIADEFDYFATIPMSALAMANGKYYTSSRLADYYSDLQTRDFTKEGAVKAFIEEYADIGLSDQKLSADVRKSSDELKALTALYTIVSVKVNEATKNGQKKISEAAMSKIASDALKTSKANVSQAEVVKEVQAQVDNVRADYYFRNVITPAAVELAADTREDRGTMDIEKGDGKQLTKENDIVKEEGQQEVIFDVLGNAIVNAETAVTDAASAEDTDQTGRKTILTPEQFQAKLSKMVDEYYAKFGDVFTKAQIREHLVTGMSAVEIYRAQSGSYAVLDGKVIITNDGQPVENLTLPGMAVLESLLTDENGKPLIKALTKPTKETFVSNSTEAMGVFTNLIAFSGTFSNGVKGLMSDLGFAGDVEGGVETEPKVVGIYRALVQKQAAIAEVIKKSMEKVAAKGYAAVNLIMTPDSDTTAAMVRNLKENNGVKDSEIAYLSLENIDEQLSGYKAILQDKMHLTVEQAQQLSIDKKLETLQECLKVKVKSGEVRYIVGDAYLLGRGWNVGKMDTAVSNLKSLSKEMTGQAVTQEKVQCTLWMVNMDKMTATQREQALGRVDHYGNNRFDRAFYNKEVVEITSVESARENKTLRDAAAAGKKGWSIELINQYLDEVMDQNEKQVLAKAGQKEIKTQAAQYSEQNTETVNVEDVMASFQTRGVESVEAQSMLQEMGIDLNQKTTLDTATAFKVASLIRYLDFARSTVPEAQKIAAADWKLTADEAKIVAEGKPEAILQIVVNKAEKAEIKSGTLDDMKALLAAVKNYGDRKEQLDALTKKLEDNNKMNKIRAISKKMKDPEAQKGINALLNTIAFFAASPSLVLANARVRSQEKKVTELTDSLAETFVAKADNQADAEAVALFQSLYIDAEGNLAIDEKAASKANVEIIKSKLTTFSSYIERCGIETTKLNWDKVTLAEVLKGIDSDPTSLVSKLTSPGKASTVLSVAMKLTPAAAGIVGAILMHGESFVNTMVVNAAIAMPLQLVMPKLSTKIGRTTLNKTAQELSTLQQAKAEDKNSLIARIREYGLPVNTGLFFTLGEVATVAKKTGTAEKDVLKVAAGAVSDEEFANILANYETLSTLSKSGDEQKKAVDSMSLKELTVAPAEFKADELVNAAMTKNVEKMLNEWIMSVMQAKDINAYLPAVMRICQNTTELSSKLGVSEQASGVEVNKAYLSKCNETMKLAKAGILSPVEAEVQIGVYKTVRNILVAISAGSMTADEYNNPQPTADELGRIATVLADKKTVAENTVVAEWAQEQKQADQQVEIVVDAKAIAELQKAVVTKTDEGFFKKLFAKKESSEAEILDGKLKAALGGSYSSSFASFDRSIRLMDPVSSKSFTQSA